MITNKLWIPLWVDKWLFGSTRVEFQPDERSVWIDLLAIGSKNNGYICANETTPYLDSQLAGLLVVSIELLQRAKQKCIKYNKLEELANGILHIVNWEKYQLTPRHQSRLTDDDNDDMPTNEVQLKQAILQYLQQHDINHEVEKIGKSGRIDIFINTDPPQIIEIKGAAYADQIRSGIRQLLEYGIEYPSAELFLAVPHPNEITTRLKEKLRNYGIKLYSCPTKRHNVRQEDPKVNKSKIKKSKEKIPASDFRHQGIIFYRLKLRFEKFYQTIIKQPYPGMNEKQIFKIMQQLHNKFNDAHLWAGFSSSQFTHTCKIMRLFFKIGVSKKWWLSPKNLLNKCDRLQLILTKGDDGVYDPTKMPAEEQPEIMPIDKALGIIERDQTTDAMVRILRSLSPVDKGEFIRHCNARPELQGVLVRAQKMRIALAKKEA